MLVQKAFHLVFKSKKNSLTGNVQEICPCSSKPPEDVEGGKTRDCGSGNDPGYQ
jgi:hypothetical protein